MNEIKVSSRPVMSYREDPCHQAVCRRGCDSNPTRGEGLERTQPFQPIAWVVEEPSKTLLESQPEIDEVIVVPRKRWTEGIVSPLRIGRTLAEVFRFVRALRERRFDTTFDFHGLLKSGLLSYLSGAATRVGFDRRWSKEWNFLFSNIRANLPEDQIKKMNRFEQNLGLLRGIGLDVKDVKTGLSVPPGDREVIKTFFRNLATPMKRPLIAIHPGTSQKTRYKRWMLDRYAQLSDRFIRELGATVLFTWGPDELEWVKAIQKEMKEPSILGPQTESITQLAESLPALRSLCGRGYGSHARCLHDGGPRGRDLRSDLS